MGGEYILPKVYGISRIHESEAVRRNSFNRLDKDQHEIKFLFYFKNVKVKTMSYFLVFSASERVLRRVS